MERRDVLKTILLATVFPFDYSGGDGHHWATNHSETDETQFVFERYSKLGEKDAEVVVSGSAGEGWVIFSHIDTTVQKSDEYNDRALALDHAQDLMQRN